MDLSCFKAYDLRGRIRSTAAGATRWLTAACMARGSPDVRGAVAPPPPGAGTPPDRIFTPGRRGGRGPRGFRADAAASLRWPAEPLKRAR